MYLKQQPPLKEPQPLNALRQLHRPVQAVRRVIVLCAPVVILHLIVVGHVRRVEQDEAPLDLMLLRKGLSPMPVFCTTRYNKYIRSVKCNILP